MHVRSIALAAALAFSGVVAVEGVAEAQKAKKTSKASKAKGSSVERKFGGQILTSDKRFPTSARSESAYISALNKQKKTRLWENKADQEWNIHFAAFFKQPLGDLEYTVKLYDVTRGQHLLSSFEQYTTSADQRSLLSSLTLQRKQFGVNKRILMTIEVRGRVVASGRFEIAGQAEKYTGKVDFTEDD
jgi:hypothetical protein